MKFMMQSCLMVADEICDGGSKMLRGFKSPFSATAYNRCVEQGMEFCGLLTPSELGTDNLFDSTDATDAAIEAVLDGKCDFVLCNDVYGKIARQAAQSGLYFIQGAYGTVSRFGIMQMVSSADRVGILCKKLSDGVEVLNAISGCDELDGTILPEKSYSYSTKSEYTPTSVNCDEIEMKYMDVLSAVFYAIASAEICNNTNRYDGVKFGYRAENINGINDLYVKSRTEGLGKDVQIASLVGCMVLAKGNYERWYDKAMRIRRLVRDYYSQILENSDVLILPASVRGEDKFDQLSLYALSALCGFATVSGAYRGAAVQFVCKRGRENAMFAMMSEG